MPRIISFAWTTPALVAGAKTVTRRDWDSEYARRFRAGEEVLAYDRSPRAGGRPVARLRLTAAPTFERDADAPDADYDAEGFRWLLNRAYDKAFADGWDHPAPEIVDRLSWEGFDEWRRMGGSSWVIRFQVLELLRPQPRPKAAPVGQIAMEIGA